MELSLADPKGLIRESYAIEGISAPECRSIFFDWALSLAGGTDEREAIRVLLAHYGAEAAGQAVKGAAKVGVGVVEAVTEPLRD